MRVMQILTSNQELSNAAYNLSQAQYPQHAFHPPDGPMAAVHTPQFPADHRVAARYHVVLTADASTYAAWQSLVRDQSLDNACHTCCCSPAYVQQRDRLLLFLPTTDCGAHLADICTRRGLAV